MAPRSYTQRRRAESAAATRDRILGAAIDSYRELGVTGTTLKAVAQRADVSRGTILHHFGDADGLMNAVLEVALTGLELPDERALEGATTREVRIRRYVEAMLRLFDRTSDWWAVFAGEGSELPPLEPIRAAEARFWMALAGLREAALGALAVDRVMAAAVATLVHPIALASLRQSSLSLDETIELTGDLLVDLAARRARGPE